MYQWGTQERKFNFVKNILHDSVYRKKLIKNSSI